MIHIARSSARKTGFVSKLWRVLAATSVLACVVTSDSHALCGDIDGDGYVTATDALRTLGIATSGTYSARADVSLRGRPDDQVSATDALVILSSAIATEELDCAARHASVVATLAVCPEFSTGGLARISTDDYQIQASDIGAPRRADAVIRVQNNRSFVINRLGQSNLEELDPQTLASKWQCSVGASTNPYDLALISNRKAFVTRYSAIDLAVVNPRAAKNGNCDRFFSDKKTIDLSPYADEDGSPQMDQMLLLGDRIFILLQRLDHNSGLIALTTGTIVVLNAVTNEHVATIPLRIKNPFVNTKGLVYDRSSHRILVAGPGRFAHLAADTLEQQAFLIDGGIELVNPDTLSSDRVLMTGAELGGDILDIALLGSDRAFALVADEQFAVRLVELDLKNATVGATLLTSTNDISDIEISERGRIWLADRNCTNPGFRVFSALTHEELTTTPIYPGMAPFTLAFTD